MTSPASLQPFPNPPPQRKRHGVRNGCLLSFGIVAVAAVVIGVVAAALGGGGSKTAGHPAATSTTTAAPVTAAPPVTYPEGGRDRPRQQNLTKQRPNAHLIPQPKNKNNLTIDLPPG